jgi:hypothetical protein
MFKLLMLTAALETFVEEDDEQTNQGNYTENNEGCIKRVHFSTSLPSRK